MSSTFRYLSRRIREGGLECVVRRCGRRSHGASRWCERHLTAIMRPEDATVQERTEYLLEMIQKAGRDLQRGYIKSIEDLFEPWRSLYRGSNSSDGAGNEEEEK